jgi:GAF domain-containing protein
VVLGSGNVEHFPTAEQGATPVPMPDDPALATAQTFAAVGRDLLAADGVEETLDVLVHLAPATISGCDHASVSLVTGRKVRTAASTGPIPRRVDAIQIETGEGPCLDAIRQHEVFVSDDLAAERRWPNFATRAAATGVRSMLGVRLFADQDTMGALNLYSDSAAAFDEMAEAFAVVLAAHASIALSAARVEENLGHAVQGRDIIGQAKGILVERRRVTPNQAFELLRAASQHRNVKLARVASDLVESGVDPETEHRA